MLYYHLVAHGTLSLKMRTPYSVLSYSGCEIENATMQYAFVFRLCDMMFQNDLTPLRHRPIQREAPSQAEWCCKSLEGSCLTMRIAR